LTGYVVIATVLLLLGFSFVDVLSKLNGDPSTIPSPKFLHDSLLLDDLLADHAIITMRTFALEKFTGTYETLMTTPVSDMVVVLSNILAL
jgi:ABC-type transport system involved in multi-copper enzyme maturation permease subunit